MNGKIRTDLLITGKEEQKKSVFSVNYMQKNVDPLINFHEFAYGNWLKNNPIPGDKYRWSASDELDARNLYLLGKILEEASDHFQENSIKGQLGRFYISAMNLEKHEELGTHPIKQLMTLVDSIEDQDSVYNLIPAFHKKGIMTLFSQETFGDLKNSSKYAFYLSQGGISMPSRDYYEKEEFNEIRTKFTNHVDRMFKLFGESGGEHNDLGKRVLKLETAIAKNSRYPEELRDPERNYNKTTVSSIDEFTGSKRFADYLKEMGLGKMDYLIVGQPEFFKNLVDMLREVPVNDWKIYIKWRVIHACSPYLTGEIERENFEFYQKALLGQKEMERKWKKITKLTDHLFGEALGKLYVDKYFGEESKARMEQMVDDLKEVFKARIENLDWMGQETKEKALEKFSRFRAKIGYPSKFIDYSQVEVKDDDFFGNVMRAAEFEINRNLSRVGKDVDRELWEMTPPTVNAYFSPTDNEIVFPAGILQPPFFDPDMDDAVNYGATGGTIAHEITHGFDDEGRKFDKDGNLGDWWTEEDKVKFEEKANSVVKLYSSYDAIPGVKINGKLTLGENIADLGGITIALEALKMRLKKNPEMNKRINGLTPIQRFFLGWAQGWRTNSTDEYVKMQVSRDPHSPDNIRADLPCMVCDDFEEAFREFSNSGKCEVPRILIW